MTSCTPSSPSLPPLLVDEKFRIESRLGSGGMGVVYRAVDVFLERAVALKIVEPDLPEAAARELGERFIKEARALARVRHENVVQVYAFGPYDASNSKQYLAMELVEGPSLDMVIERVLAANTVMPLPRAMSILSAVARGLAAVHAAGIVHRDIKPSNIILEKGSERPVLIDFGLARRQLILLGGGDGMAPPGSVRGEVLPGATVGSDQSMIGGCGTPSYVAPEQAIDPTGEATPRSDLYSLACTAFELFTGRMVFEEDESVLALLMAHANRPPPKIGFYRPELECLNAVFDKALAKDPKDRYETTTAFIAAITEGLEKATSGIVSAGRPPPPSPPLPPPPSSSSSHALVLAENESFRRSLMRRTDMWLRGHGIDEVSCAIDDAEAMLKALRDRDGEQPPRLVIVDEESAGDSLPEIIALAEAKHAQTVIVSRDPKNMTKAAKYVVPKPFNSHILDAVLDRTGIDSDAEFLRRSA